MKIAVISPNPQHLRQAGKILGAQSHAVALVEGGRSRMRTVAEQEQPDLLMVDGMCCDPEELNQVEYVTTHHPQMAVLLLCANQSPEFLLNAMRVGVREVLPSPASDDALIAAVNRVDAKLHGHKGKGQGRVLAFMSCKGGSGATFLATNLGYQLMKEKSVLLIDLNVQFGDALSFVHDGKPVSTLADVAQNIDRLDASLLAASAVKIAPGYSILAAPEDPAQAMEVKPEHIDAILNLATAQYDFVLLDLGRNIDALTIKALDRAYRVFLVLQAGLPDLRNAGKLLGMFRSLGYGADKSELVVNRFDKTGQIGIADMQKLLGPVRLHTVPNSYKEVNASINQGNPMIEMARSNAVTKYLAEFAALLTPKREESRGLLERFFKRA